MLLRHVRHSSEPIGSLAAGRSERSTGPATNGLISFGRRNKLRALLFGLRYLRELTHLAVKSSFQRSCLLPCNRFPLRWEVKLL